MTNPKHTEPLQTFQETIAEVLYQFSKYCRHHARTALGGAGINQSEAQATLNKELLERLERLIETGVPNQGDVESHAVKYGWNAAIDKVIQELGLNNLKKKESRKYE